MNEFIEKTNYREKKVASAEIIVTGTKDKPYFEIKYKEVGKEDYSIGYSSYDLNNVFDWKEDCFEIVNQPAEEYNGGWIPCSERLPEEDVEVLVYIKDCEGNYFYDLTYFHIVWQTEIGGMYSSVIAWQPLPEPYNPKGE